MWCMYQPAWEHLPEMRSWLTQSPNDRSRAFCKICKIEITAIISSLRQHADKHRHVRVDAASVEQLDAFELEDVDEQELEEEGEEQAEEKEDGGRTTESSQPDPPSVPPNKAKRSRRDNFQPEWKAIPELKEWLCRSPRRPQWAFCKACNKELQPHKQQLLGHARTKPHLRRMERLAVRSKSTTKETERKKVDEENEKEKSTPARRSRRIQARMEQSTGKGKKRAKADDGEGGIVLAPIGDDVDKTGADNEGEESAMGKKVEESGRDSDIDVGDEDEDPSELQSILRDEGLDADEDGESHLVGPMGDELDDDAEWGRSVKRSGGFKDAWRRDPRFSAWLRRSAGDSRRAFCLYCFREIAGSLPHIERHSTRPMHQRKASLVRFDKPTRVKDEEPDDEVTGGAMRRKKRSDATVSPVRVLEYDPKWENEPEVKTWLRRSRANPRLAYCISCQKDLTPKLMHLKRHGASFRHNRFAMGHVPAKKPKRVYFNRRRALELLPLRKIPTSAVTGSKVQKVNTNYGEIRIEYGAVGGSASGPASQTLSEGSAAQSVSHTTNASQESAQDSKTDGDGDQADLRHREVWAALEAMEEMDAGAGDAPSPGEGPEAGTQPAPCAVRDIVQQSLERAEADLNAVQAVSAVTGDAAGSLAQPRKKGSRRRPAKHAPKTWVTASGKVYRDYTTYNPQWQLIPGMAWLRPVADNPRQAFCIWCRRVMVAKLALVNRHRQSARHIRLRIRTTGVETKADVEMLSMMKRKQKFAEAKGSKAKKPTTSQNKDAYLRQEGNEDEVVDDTELIEKSANPLEEVETSELPFGEEMGVDGRDTFEDAAGDGLEQVSQDAACDDSEEVFEDGAGDHSEQVHEEGAGDDSEHLFEDDVEDGEAKLESKMEEEPIRGLVATVLPKFEASSSSTDTETAPASSEDMKPPITPSRQSTRERRPAQHLCVLNDYLAEMRNMYRPRRSPFHRVWKKHPEISSWLQRSPWSGASDTPFCRVCRHELTPKTAHLLRHARTQLHLRRMGERAIENSSTAAAGSQAEGSTVSDEGVNDSTRQPTVLETVPRSAEPMEVSGPSSQLQHQLSDEDEEQAVERVENATSGVAGEVGDLAVLDICRVCKHPLVAGVNIFSTRTTFSRTLVASKLSRLLQAPVSQDLADTEVCSSCVKLLNDLDQSEMRVTALENEVKLKYKMPCPLAVQGQLPPVQVKDKEDAMVQAVPDELLTAYHQETIIIQDAGAVEGAEGVQVQPEVHIQQEPLPQQEIQVEEGTQSQLLTPQDTYFTIDENGQLKPITALYDAEGNMLNIMYQVPDAEEHVVDADHTTIYWETDPDADPEPEFQQPQHQDEEHEYEVHVQEQYTTEPQAHSNAAQMAPQVPAPKRARKAKADGSEVLRRPRKTLREVAPGEDWTTVETWNARELAASPTPALPAPANWVPPEARPRGRPRRDAPLPHPNSQLVFGQCSVCGIIFQDNVQLRKHMVKTHADLLYRCDVCMRPFLHKSSLREHELRHKGNNFQCNECGKMFGANSDLQKHRVFVHTTERAFACDMCTYAGKFKWMLDRHRRTVHGSSR